MSALIVSSLAIVLAVLAVIAFGPQLRARISGSRGRARRSHRPERLHLPDPGKRLRAERRAERLLGEVVGAGALAEYRALGFLHAFGVPEADGRPGYGYLIYPHRPIVSFDARSGELLSELCVTFPERGPDGEVEWLPDADDVLAKWMGIRGSEEAVLAEANINPPGRQVDPAQARRDIVRLGEWSTWSSSDGLATPS